MKSRSTFTISRSNTGWRPKRGIRPFFFLVFVIFGVLLLYGLHQIVTSKYLSTRERITIGVYDEIPYVFSYDKRTNLGTVMYFDPDANVEVPGDYGWYKLGSVRLLATIEHKTTELLERTFARLVGVPVDMVIYRNSSDVLSEINEDFLDYFMKKRGSQSSLSKEYGSSIRNLADRLFIRKILDLSPDRLIAVNAENDYVLRAGKPYYTEQKLDSHLKGFLYQRQLTSSGIKVRVIAHDDEYRGAQMIGRLVEGMGTKVLSIDLTERKLERCEITSEKSGAAIARLLGIYFPCTVRQDPKGENNVVIFHMGKNIATLYL